MKHSVLTIQVKKSKRKKYAYGLKDYYSCAEDTEKVIINCALVAAGADAVGSIIPGLAIPATIASCFGAVWVMYGKLCNTLGISLKENTLKRLAKAALANITANLGGALAAMFVGMFIPGASIFVSATVAFITIYLAGIVLLNLILNMAKKSANPYTFSDISADDMKKTVSGTKLSKEDLKAARNAYNQNK